MVGFAFAAACRVLLLVSDKQLPILQSALLLAYALTGSRQQRYANLCVSESLLFGLYDEPSNLTINAVSCVKKNSGAFAVQHSTNYHAWKFARVYVGFDLKVTTEPLTLTELRCVRSTVTSNLQYVCGSMSQ